MEEAISLLLHSLRKKKLSAKSYDHSLLLPYNRHLNKLYKMRAQETGLQVIFSQHICGNTQKNILRITFNIRHFSLINVIKLRVVAGS